MVTAGGIQRIVSDSLQFDSVRFTDVISLCHQITGRVPNFHFFVIFVAPSANGYRWKAVKGYGKLQLQKLLHAIN